MTSASERTDDDVIVITDEQVVDPARADAGDLSTPEGRDLSDNGDVADDGDLATDDDSAADTLAANDGTVGDSTDDLTTTTPVLSGDDADLDATPAGAPFYAASDADPADADYDVDAVDASPDADTGFTSGYASGAGATAVPDSSDAVSADPITDPAVTDAVTADDAPDAALVTSPASSSAASNWPEIQAMFVDDPRSAVERAAQVAGSALEALVSAAREQEQSLRQAWEADGTGTEELRTSLQRYRELATRLNGLSQEI